MKKSRLPQSFEDATDAHLGCGPSECRPGERSETGRNGEGPHPVAALPESKAAAPDPEVREKTQRRRFTADYKARIVREADACTQFGQVGALLRREGLYTSHLGKWRRQYRQGGRVALTDDRRGRPPAQTPLEMECERLRRQVGVLEKRLQQAETIIAIQKKISELLGIESPTSASGGNNS